ncbi:YwqG family protein [Fusobacterium varium]|uniref:YwqG family protein n=1 Tax=Fusobacterium varium TaxID=856 RepID=UPI00356AE197
MISEEKLEKLKRNTILLSYDETNSEKLSKGTSKIGGKPDLPKDFKWYYYEGEDCRNRIKNRPLSFLMQINCEEVHKYDKETLLPEKGILYFFYELLSMTWGFSPMDKGSAKVFYYDGNIDDLVSIDFPEDLDKKCILPELKIKLENMNDYPEFYDLDFENEDRDKDYFEETERKIEEYHNLIEGLGYKYDTTKLLGYPEFIQNNFFEECEGVSRKNIYYGSVPIEYRNLKKVIKENAKDWILLMQMSELYSGNYALVFGDAGKIYFNIRKEDLKNKKFDDAWLILQCY